MPETKKRTWYEDESFWKTFESTMFNQERLDAAGEEVDKIVKLLAPEKDAKILDLCCGIGRHSLELARRGYQVVGVDLTEEYLAKARRQAESEGLTVQFVRSDMRRFCQIESFDAVINMFTAFGYFEQPADNKRVLANIRCSLRKGGTLILDTIGKEILARIFQERDWHEQDGRIFLREHKMKQNWSWAENRWIMFENGKVREFRFGHRIYSGVEMMDMLNECGFRSVSIYGDLEGADYDHNAKRLVVIARK
ncbi:MAG: methyltransferase domain-containing protein [Sedimentisphaerales bacterium]|nr:methyltransferase domain-containing protein [Sedimentisphaerales bacterium]